MSVSKKKFSLDKLKKTDQLVVRTGKQQNVDRVIFPNPVEVGLDSESLRSALTTHGGVKIPDGIPAETRNVLYNELGVLKFNGQPVITGSNGIVHLERLGVTGSIDISGPLRVTGGIVTDDADSEFIRAGDRIQVAKNSDGSYTITADVQAGGSGGSADPQYLTLAATSDLNNERVFTAGTGINVVDGGAGGNFTVSTDSSVVPNLTGNNTFSGDVTVQGDIKGSVQKLSDGTTNFIQAGSNVTVANNVDGSITISATDTNTDTTYTSGNGLSLSSNTFSVNLQPGGGLQIVSSRLAVDTSDIAGDGLRATNSNTTLSVDASQIAGSGLEDDGSENLRISTSAAGSGLTGGGGAPLSVDLKTSGGLKTVSDELAIEAADIAGDGLSDNGSDQLKLDIGSLQTELTDGQAELTDYIAVSDSSDNTTKKLTINRLKTLVDNTSVIYTAGDGLTQTGQTFRQRAVLSVTAANGVFVIDGSARPKITAPKTLDYYFDLSDASLSGRVFALSETFDGTHASGGVQFTNGVTMNGTPGNTGAYLEVKFTQEDPDVLYYYDANTSGMGNKLITGLGYLETDTATVTYTGKGIFPEGIEGSIQKLSDGTTDFNQAGNNIVVTNNVDGSITIASDVSSAFTSGDGIDIVGGEISADIRAGGGLRFNNEEMEVDPTVVPLLTGATFTGTVTVNGAANIQGSIQKLADGTTDFIQAGSNVTVTNNADGSITIAASGGSGSGGSGTIGSAEDGDYTDGLFTDFTDNTEVGTAIDRFNEVLKSLAPDPAPNLNSISATTSASQCKLSFGSSNSLSGYENIQGTAGLGTALDTNGLYTQATSNSNVRIGAVSSGTTITGIVGSGVTENSFAGNVVNYPENSIGNGDQGILSLNVNGTTIRTVDLTDSNLGAGLPGSGTDSVLTGGSGFINISQVASGKFSNGSSFDVFKHRTMNFQIDASHQRNGWNYVQVVHTVGSSNYTTNYIEWLVDESQNPADQITASNNTLTGLSMTGSRYLSGVQYHTGGTANYQVDVANAYKDVYTTSNITFTGTSCSSPSQSMPIVAPGEDSSKTITVSSVATITDTKMLNEAFSLSINVPHPLRANLNSGGQSSIGGILVYNVSENSTVLSENFNGETYRLRSGNFASQSDVSNSSWNSETDIESVGAGNHASGLIVYNDTLVSPTSGINSGDFRNVADGGIIGNGPDGNVNYSGATGTRTYYRRFTNNTGGSRNNFNLSMNTSGTNIVSSSGTLNSSNIRVDIKLPQTDSNFSTAWLDISQPFATGQVDSDGDGCLVGNFDSSSNSTNSCTFGTQSVGDEEYIVVRITADTSWTGNIIQMSVSWT